MKIKKRTLIIIILIIVALTPLVITSSRYVITKVSESYLNSKKFYFTSKTLNGTTYEIYNWNGTSDYTLNIDINNNLDNLNWTNYNINYDIETTCECDNKIIECTNRRDNILTKYNDQYTTNTENIVISKGSNTFNTGDVVIVNVTATSTYPYEKSLTGTFNIHVSEKKISYSIKDETNKEYLELLISNQIEDKSVEVIFDETKIRIDNTNYYVKNGVTTTTLIDSKNIIDKLTFDTEKGNVYSIRFYKVDKSQNYTFDTNVINVS